MKKPSGITLIALVITIIVLLILAGVSLNAVLGENGILSRAEKAEKAQNISRIQEKLELLKGQILLDGKTVNLDNYLSVLEEKKEEYDVKHIDKVDSNNAYTVIEEEYKFLIKDTENGDVEIIIEGNVGELTLSETAGEFKYPEIKTFTVTKNTSGGKLTVSSSNEEIAKATINGNEVTVESGLTEGTAIITVTSEATEEYGENKAKYTAKVGNGELEVTATPYSGEYDGNAHGITVTCLTNDVIIEYSSDGETYSTTNPTYTNVGIYTTYYRVSKAGYKTVEGSLTVTIEGVALADVVSVGDYVEYDATNNYSYASPTGTGSSHGNGYSKQTFTSSSSLKWRVLNTNTLTKEVVLISESPIQTDAGSNFYINGPIGYLYLERELSEICKIYGYGKGANTSKTFSYTTGDLIEGTTKGKITGSGATSLKAEDINTITGYKPTTGASYTHTIYYPTTTTTRGYSDSAVSRTDTDTIYTYKGSTYLSGTTYNMLFKDTKGSSDVSYWLASRAVTSDSEWAAIHARIVKGGGVSVSDYFGIFYDSTSFGGTFSSGIRPIVYLKTTVQTSGQNASGAWDIIEE